jgi:hypothetical protein
MTYKMLRRTKSSSLLPIVRLTNYFYPESSGVEGKVDDLGLSTTSATNPGALMDIYPGRNGPTSSSSLGGLTPPPDYEQLYHALQLDNFDGTGDDRVRKKYACQGLNLTSKVLIAGLKLVASALAEDSSAISNKEVGFSRDLYVNGVEYILRGLPRV